MSYKPNFEQLDKLVEQGYLSKKEDGDLVLYNYSDKCTFEKKWNKHTENSRGTIYSKSTGKIISQAFPKFFNFSELAVSKQRNILKQVDFLTMTKMDGSMGNVFFHNGKWRVTTRGSFSSDQAIYATEVLLPMYEEELQQTSRKCTFLVEIIYPENRIIVNYGSQKELITLAGFYEGKEIDYTTLVFSSPFPVVDTHQSNSIEELIETVSKMPAQEEGFVVKLKSGERVKFKSPEYLKVARIITRMSPLTLWESMVDSKVSTELMMSIPEEFRDVYEQFQKELEAKYVQIEIQARNRTEEALNAINYITLSPDEVRKNIGLYLKTNHNELNQFVFPILLDSKPNIDKMIMKYIRPTGNIL